MNAIVNSGPGRLELREIPIPEPGVGQVRIRTAACGICASDIEMIDGCFRSDYPHILGHEWSGVVHECGPTVDPSLCGRPCVGENMLARGGEIGFEHPGGYAEFFLTDASNIHVLPDGFPMDEAALIEPLAVTVRGIERLRPSCGPALIIGDGAIGLLTLMLLRRAGVQEIVMVGGREARLRLSIELGAARTINYHELQRSLADELSESDAGKFSTIVEAAKSPDAVDLALRLGALEAKILLIGFYGESAIELPLQPFLMNELELISSNASARAWPAAVALAAGRELPLERLITKRFPAEDFEQAMKTARTDRAAVKTLLCWQSPARGETQ